MQQVAVPKKEVAPPPPVDQEVDDKPQLSGEALGFHNPGTYKCNFNASVTFLLLVLKNLKKHHEGDFARHCPIYL